jgi:hypothetical protein
VLASTAVTTGLFVLAGVVVGGLVTGAVNYAFEWRRERARLQIAMRLLEDELARAGAFADWRLEQGGWAPWDFQSAHRTWNEYRPDIVIGLSSHEWYSVAVAFAAIEAIEDRFSNKPVATTLNVDEQKALNGCSESILEGANTLRRRQGLQVFARF